jgi:hypothetical protein
MRRIALLVLVALSLCFVVADSASARGRRGRCGCDYGYYGCASGGCYSGCNQGCSWYPTNCAWTCCDTGTMGPPQGEPRTAPHTSSNAPQAPTPMQGNAPTEASRPMPSSR